MPDRATGNHRVFCHPKMTGGSAKQQAREVHRSRFSSAALSTRKTDDARHQPSAAIRARARQDAGFEINHGEFLATGTRAPFVALIAENVKTRRGSVSQKTDPECAALGAFDRIAIRVHRGTRHQEQKNGGREDELEHFSQGVGRGKKLGHPAPPQDGPVQTRFGLRVQVDRAPMHKFSRAGPRHR